MRMGMTQAELAEKTGLSEVYISYIEVGCRVPALKKLIRIAKTLQIKMDDLFVDLYSDYNTEDDDSDICSNLKLLDADEKNAIRNMVNLLLKNKLN